MALIARNLDTGAVIADRVGVADTRATRRGRAAVAHRPRARRGAVDRAEPRRPHLLDALRHRRHRARRARRRSSTASSNLRPWRIRLPRRGTAGVLELPAGTLAAPGTAVGHRIQLDTAMGASMRGRRRDDASRRAADRRRPRRRSRAAGAAGDDRGDRAASRHARAAAAEDADRRRGQRHRRWPRSCACRTRCSTRWSSTRRVEKLVEVRGAGGDRHGRLPLRADRSRPRSRRSSSSTSAATSDRRRCRSRSTTPTSAPAWRRARSSIATACRAASSTWSSARACSTSSARR